MTCVCDVCTKNMTPLRPLVKKRAKWQPIAALDSSSLLSLCRLFFTVLQSDSDPAELVPGHF